MIGEIVPVLGVLVGLVVPLACFFWAYHEDKGKREAVVEIAKHLDDPAKIEELLTMTSGFVGPIFEWSMGKISQEERDSRIGRERSSLQGSL